MRVWDVNPGYLNRASLLGEHREIHGLLSVLLNGKKGYSRHPETLRWVEKLFALKQRHECLVSEMTLRGYNHYSPFPDLDDVNQNGTNTPPPHLEQLIYIDKPHRQFEILATKYTHREPGRIPLPRNGQELWAQHKYSILARNPAYYRTIGPLLAKRHEPDLFNQLAQEFVEMIRTVPAQGTLICALQHMWGYVSPFSPFTALQNDLRLFMETIRTLAITHQITYLLHSTALSELPLYCITSIPTSA